MTTEQETQDSTVTIESGEQVETFRYDSRHKKLFRTVKSTSKIILAPGEEPAGVTVNTSVQEYSTDGIRALVQKMKQHQDGLAQNFTSVNRTLEATKDVETDEELNKLRLQLERLPLYDKRQKALDQKDFLLKDSETTRKQINAVMKAIQGHLDIE